MELKYRSPEVAATTKGAFDNSYPHHSTNTHRANQEAKHVTFFILRAMESIEKVMQENVYG
ncbi:MAG: hypothetical protein KIT56_10500 [Gammaproteobacteria bacterium]|nr:hypothetical protein [Gammaproteobacteria bacterium]MCW5584278.1 hypothetical protein [Gammaproteobacteria bacterium]